MSGIESNSGCPPVVPGRSAEVVGYCKSIYCNNPDATNTHKARRKMKAWAKGFRTGGTLKSSAGALISSSGLSECSKASTEISSSIMAETPMRASQEGGSSACDTAKHWTRREEPSAQHTGRSQRAENTAVPARPSTETGTQSRWLIPTVARHVLTSEYVSTATVIGPLRPMIPQRARRERDCETADRGEEEMS